MMKGKWPIDAVEQDTICIKSLVRLLEKNLNAEPDETRISYWQPNIVDVEGGSIELKFLVDMLSIDELNNIRHFENPEMKDGEPRITVMVQWLWDDEWRKHLIEKWETSKEEYPDSKFVEHFIVNIQIEYTKNDWNKLIEYAEEVKKGLVKPNADDKTIG